MGDLGRLRFMRTAGGLNHRNALRKKITRVTVQRLVFLDDHKMLTDISHTGVNWAAGGTKYVQKQGGAHWLAAGQSFPASVTKATRLAIEVDIGVESADADPIECVITATASLPAGDTGAPEAFTFKATAVLGGAAVVRLRLVAAAPLADHVFVALDWALSWQAVAAGRTFDMGKTGPHRLYVTYGTPEAGGRPLVHPFGEDPAPIEDGITDKRMHAAVDLIERGWRYAIKQPSDLPVDRNDPHVIAGALMSYVPGYTLDETPRSVTLEERQLVKAKYGHPQYFKPPGGAWPIYEHAKALAECQAIVRFVRGVMMQAGVPGDLRYVLVYADADANPATAVEDSIIPRDTNANKYRPGRGGKYWIPGGLNLDMPRTHAGVLQFQSLADDIVEAPRPSYPKPDPIPYGRILNAFEACMKFTHGGKTFYYGGGVPFARFASAQQVLHVFKQLVWWVTVGEPKKPDRFITEVAYPVPPIRRDGEPEYFEPDGDPSRWPG